MASPRGLRPLGMRSVIARHVSPLANWASRSSRCARESTDTLMSRCAAPDDHSLRGNVSVARLELLRHDREDRPEEEGEARDLPPVLEDGHLNEHEESDGGRQG